jgi:antitoxin component YwqK of YwqJK toxin-antitoxin module
VAVAGAGPATAGGLEPLACPAGAERRGAAPPEALAEWCEAPGPDGKARREGPARSFYDDGGLWLEESYREGQRDGPSLERHRGGAPARAGSYARGQKVGRWTVWAPDGKVEEESTWKDGVLHGPFLVRWRTGALRTTGRYCLGAQCGAWKTFDEQGKELGTVDYAEQREQP